MRHIYISFVFLVLLSCTNNKQKLVYEFDNLINYKGFPDYTYDRSTLSFSNKGSWFSYGLADDSVYINGFSGPFLMFQENGVWLSKCLSNIQINDGNGDNILNTHPFKTKQNSYLSHLEQEFHYDKLILKQTLLFQSKNTALILNEIINTQDEQQNIKPVVFGQVINPYLTLKIDSQDINIISSKSLVDGKITVDNTLIDEVSCNDSIYSITLKNAILKSNLSFSFVISHTFSYDNNKPLIYSVKEFKQILNQQTEIKSTQLESILNKIAKKWNTSSYKNLLVKTILTLQNNWRSPAENLVYSGCFPSYHYKWFHGYWAWDSWKHAVALVHFNEQLAKNQIEIMYNYQETNGFIPDCVYLNDSIEKNNYRNTKPPLSAWAIWNIFEETKDTTFLKELYPRVKKYHEWWYAFRDFDKDSLCEYGSTDGTLIAAKWESGMDNAIRFDTSSILKSNENAYSLNQESVDLNSYLYAEKIYLAHMAKILGYHNHIIALEREACVLKNKIQDQFWDDKTAWFYDTDIDGKSFIKVMGPEGWIPMWAEIATNEQAQRMKDNMMNSSKFLTKIPFPTVSADHPNFEPDGGYWRGPVWTDQAYFAVKGLRNYNYTNEANIATKMLIENAEGLLEKGPSIRENYNPLTGEGLESQNFSWSAAHYFLLLLEE